MAKGGRFDIRDNRKAYDEVVKSVLGVASGIEFEFGIFGEKGGDETREGGLTVVEIATVHEFGGGHVPERSFLRAFVEQYEADLRELLRRLLLGVTQGIMTRDEALERFGVFVVNKIKERIAAGIEPALAESTLASKGPDKFVPLINTGQMRNSVTFRVKQGNVSISFPDPGEL